MLKDRSFWPARAGFYLAGVVLLAAGITLTTKTGLGASALISMPFVVSNIFSLNFAALTFCMYALFVAVQFPIKGKNRQWRDLLQLPFSFVFSLLLDVFDRFLDFHFPAIWQNVVLLLVALVLTGVGAAMMVDMRLIANPADSLAKAVGDRLHRDMGFGKNVLDITCVAISCAIGLIFAHKLVGVGIGTICAMLLVGRVVALFNRLCKAPMQRLARISDTK